MDRRKAIKKIAKVGIVASLAPHILVGKSKEIKIGIEGAKVFSKGKFVDHFVGITQEGTIRLFKEPVSSETVINANGKVLSAGFIDILGDNSTNQPHTTRVFEKYKLTDGVTTVLQMHGGSGNPKKFYANFQGKSHYSNYGVSTKVMVIRGVYNTINSRKQAIIRALEAGALGVSHSIEYQPTPYAEVLQYAQLAKKYNRPFTLHLRHSSKEKELEGVKEAIMIAQETGVKLHMAHLHSTGGTFKMPQALDLISTARQQGLEITTCVYPYTYWATYLHSKRFGKGWKARYGLTYSDLTVVGTGEKLSSTRFYQLRKKMGVLVAVPPGTMPASTTIDLALQKDYCMIGSDGGIQTEPRANNHPRGAGCFATAIRYGLDIGLPLEKILPKLTTLPKQLIGKPLKYRGDIAEGFKADLVLFDPQTIDGKATVANPNQFSKGIHKIILNGDLVYQNGIIKSSKGKAIISL